MARDYVDPAAVSELLIHIQTDSRLYSQSCAVAVNLLKKRIRGTYNSELALKAFAHIADAGAKSYVKEYMHGATWSNIFTPVDRKEVTRKLRNEFESQAKLGELDWLLEK